MQSLSKSDEQQLLDGVKTAVDLVDNQNLSPNDALQKVAVDMQYSPGFLKAACNAFNTGRQLAQWDANDDVLDKLASFPLADYDVVHNSIWGTKEEKVASVSSAPHYFNSYEEQARQEFLQMALPSMEKSAEVYNLHPMVADENATMRGHRAYSAFDYARREAEEARREKTAAEDQLHFKMHMLEQYFRKFAYDRLPLAQVEAATAVHYGARGRALMDYVAERLPKEKRAADHDRTWSGFNQPANRMHEPYTLIDAVIKQAKLVHLTSGKLVQVHEKLAAAQEAGAPFSQPRHRNLQSGSQSILTPSLIDAVSGEKSADIWSGLTGGMAAGVGREAFNKTMGNSQELIQQQVRELDDPSHLNEMRKIRAQTVLTQLLSDPESPLSQHDPEDVLTAYNEMVQLSPRLADQPSIIGPLLNKRMMGNVEPFEVGETLKLEQGLKQTQGTPSVGSSAPSKKMDLMKNEASILS